jgi:hypothetical protein
VLREREIGKKEKEQKDREEEEIARIKTIFY